MAYEIIGRVYKVGQTEQIATKSGGQLLRRSLILEQHRYDPNTGREFTPNYPCLEFTNQACQQLDRYTKGCMVRVRFDLSGGLYTDKASGEERGFTRLRAFGIEPYTPPQQAQAGNYAPTAQSVRQQARNDYQRQDAPQGRQQQGNYPPPQGGYAPPTGYAPQDDAVPF